MAEGVAGEGSARDSDGLTAAAGCHGLSVNQSIRFWIILEALEIEEGLKLGKMNTDKDAASAARRRP